MWPNAGVDFFNQYWPYDFLSQHWPPYAALAASVVVLVLLRKTWKRVRRLEAQACKGSYFKCTNIGHSKQSIQIRFQSLKSSNLMDRP
jgi:hypothetical protein